MPAAGAASPSPSSVATLATSPSRSARNTPGDLADLSHLVTLKILNLANNKSIKGALSSLSRMNLEYLDLSGVASGFKSYQIKGKVEDLISHTSLHTLDFGGDDDSRHRGIEGNVTCLGGLSKLKRVDLTCCPNIDGGA